MADQNQNNQTRNQRGNVRIENIEFAMKKGFLSTDEIINSVYGQMPNDEQDRFAIKLKNELVDEILKNTQKRLNNSEKKALKTTLDSSLANLTVGELIVAKQNIKISEVSNSINKQYLDKGFFFNKIDHAGIAKYMVEKFSSEKNQNLSNLKNQSEKIKKEFGDVQNNPNFQNIDEAKRFSILKKMDIKEQKDFVLKLGNFIRIKNNFTSKKIKNMEFPGVGKEKEDFAVTSIYGNQSNRTQHLKKYEKFLQQKKKNSYLILIIRVIIKIY